MMIIDWVDNIIIDYVLMMWFYIDMWIMNLWDVDIIDWYYIDEHNYWIKYMRWMRIVVWIWDRIMIDIIQLDW